MKYKLRESFIRRMVQIKKWESLFAAGGAVTAIIVLFQQTVPFRLEIALLIACITLGYLWNSYRALKRQLAEAQEVSFALGDYELIYSHSTGESRINYSAIEKIEVTKQEWPEVLLTMKDKRRLKIQGVESIEEIVAHLRSRTRK